MMDTIDPALRALKNQLPLGSSSRLELHRRAQAGDPEAQRMAEARQAACDARERVHQLQAVAQTGNEQALATLRGIARGQAPAPAPAARPAPAAPSASASKVDIQAAVAAAVIGERKRIAEVYAADASKGRERVAATLLASPKGFSAKAIVAELPNLPTDREHRANDPAARARTDAVWERAYAAGSGGQQGQSMDPKAQQILDAQRKCGGGVFSDETIQKDRWAKAYADAAQRRN